MGLGNERRASRGGIPMNAATCVEIAQRSSDLETKLALLKMAQSWLALAEQAIKNSETVLVYETPTTERS